MDVKARKLVEVLTLFYVITLFSESAVRQDDNISLAHIFWSFISSCVDNAHGLHC